MTKKKQVEEKNECEHGVCHVIGNIVVFFAGIALLYGLIAGGVKLYNIDLDKNNDKLIGRYELSRYLYYCDRHSNVHSFSNCLRNYIKKGD